jgi:hypothetical protein
MAEGQPRVVLVVASAAHPLVQPLLAALSRLGVDGLHCSQASAAFLALSRAARPVEQIVLLDDLPGMALPVLARSLRSLPGHARLPMLANTDPPLGLESCQTLPLPLDEGSIAALVAQGPAAWPASQPGADAVPAAASLDPVPLRRIERISPGTARELATVVLRDLAAVCHDFPRWLAQGDFDQLAGTAHRLRGSTGSVGAMETAAALGRLERAARDGGRSSCQACLDMVLQAIARVEPQLAAFAKS